MRHEPFFLNDWVVYPELNRATCGSETVHLEPKIVDVLVYLAERAGSVVSRQELMSEIWSDTIVLSDSLNRCISQLRSAFESGCDGQRIIETIRKRGYRLIADVRAVRASGDSLVQTLAPSVDNDTSSSSFTSSGHQPGNVTFSLATSMIPNWYRYSSSVDG
ncbi:MAG: transcriptional regulator [Rhodothermales bacterium]|nr:transcriptional regulator [Rhodothermales bacterium]